MKELSKIQVSLNAPKGQTNNFGKYKYRSCEDILVALKPLLSELKCHIILTDDVVMIGDRFYIKSIATLTNDKLESISVSAFARESLDKKGMDSAQITGATSSYARKYALNGLFAIDDTKEHDSLDNSDNKKSHPKRQNETKYNFDFSKDIKPLLNNKPILLKKLIDSKLRKPEIEKIWNDSKGNISDIEIVIQDILESKEAK